MKKLILLIPFLAVLYMLSSRYLLARSVECYTQYGLCPEYLVSGLENLKDYPLLQPLPANRVRSELASFPAVKSISLFRRLPSTLVVSIDLRHPVGQVLGSQSSVYGLVDEEGVIFSQSPLPLELPQLNMSQDIQPNTRLALSQSQAMSALNDIWQLTASLPVGSLEGTQLTASLRSGLNIIISVDQPASSWYPPLQSILDRSKMGSKLPKKIDMRFTNPVLMY